MNTNKQMPANKEAEKSVLASMIKNENKIPIAIDKLNSEEFYYNKHKIIFEIIIKEYEQKGKAELVSIYDKLKTLIKDISVNELTQMVDSLGTAENIEFHIDIIKEKSNLRKIIKGNSQIEKLAYENNESKEVLNKLQSVLEEVQYNKEEKELTHAKDILFKTFESLEQGYKSDSDILGVPTGFKDLDKITLGLQQSDLFILAGRPSMGKTALALNIAQHASIRENLSVAIFSLEMNKNQLIQRMLCSEAKISSENLKKGSLSEKEWKKLAQVSSKIGDSEIYIDDDPSISVMGMKAKCDRLKEEKGLDLILIDYLQLMEGNGHSQNRNRELTKISRGLKMDLARHLKVPVMALSQLSRGVEQRNDKRPKLSDLRSSGAIEQDADVVAFIYRDEYYNPDTEKKGITEIIINKQRNGGLGVVELGFEKEYTNFIDLNY